MLMDILREIAATSTHSYASLAKSLNLDQEMVKQMFFHLRSMGYIITDNPACGDDRCDECGVCCTKKKSRGIQQNKTNTAGVRWKLTEKGKKAVLDQEGKIE
ncbi:MAG: transcriptional regulator [Peptococcaceae bacterium]|nr:transcriptional regulator [Peptococcaceae bacterium]